MIKLLAPIVMVLSLSVPVSAVADSMTATDYRCQSVNTGLILGTLQWDGNRVLWFETAQGTEGAALKARRTEDRFDLLEGRLVERFGPLWGQLGSKDGTLALYGVSGTVMICVTDRVKQHSSYEILDRDTTTRSQINDGFADCRDGGDTLDRGATHGL